MKRREDAIETAREKMKRREDAIRIIEELYPADSEYEDTASIGKTLLAEAKQNMSDWRHLPDDILFEYLRLCIKKEEMIYNLST